jgi:alanine dehydrogenase
MDIGIPRQKRPYDYRVGMTPMGVEVLAKLGHRCYIESGAGQGSGFDDDRYRQAGGQIVYSTEELYGRGELILTISRPLLSEFELMPEGQVLCGFLHLAVAHPRKLEILLARNITAIGYETIQLDDGHLPVLLPASQIAGRMVPHVAAHLLQNNAGGHGILLGGVPGVPPANVVVLGAGVVGANAARAFISMGAHVTVLDTDLRRLQELEAMDGHVATMVAYDFNIARVVKRADVLVGAVLIPGRRTPVLVTREMVRTMKARAVIMDVSIDQGGCIETSRPTTYQNPTYIEEGVIHYCVPNMTGVLARTTTHAINNATWPFIREITEKGIEQALADNAGLHHGLNTHQGQLVHPALRESLESAT